MWYFISGLILSLTYVTLILIGRPDILEQFTKLSLNELGDFLAGAFSPLAFLWLVIGYLTQGKELKLNRQMLELQAEELKNNNKALLLQAKELENAVQAQNEIAKQGKEQIEFEKAKLDEEKEKERIRNSPPKIGFYIEKKEHLFPIFEDNEYYYECFIHNEGGPAINLEISISEHNQDEDLTTDANFIPNDKSKFTFLLLAKEQAQVKLFNSRKGFKPEKFLYYFVEIIYTIKASGINTTQKFYYQITDDSEFEEI